jgi:poly-gamma-glutamate biosynthesis protein PgsC/CapC
MEMQFDYQIYAYIAIGIGMVVSLFLTETLGVMAGGIIVPGYIALSLHNPIKVGFTFGISIITFFIVYILSKVVLIYGRRRLILCLLIGFFLGYIFREMKQFAIWGMDVEYIGYIIPGLIASWMDRQGIIRTAAVILMVASIVNLFLMLVFYLTAINLPNV